MDILSQIINDTKHTLVQRIKKTSVHTMRELAEKAIINKPANRFFNALNTGSMEIIAEVKKASPSKGIISENFDFLQTAREYQAGGAAALSVLTEEKYFLGSLNYLQHIVLNGAPPVLRKDFIVDEYQVFEAAVYGASAILLIASVLNTREIARFIKLAESFAMDALVEVHDKPELDKAMAADAKIIGVNNRDLKTFQTSLNKSLELVEFIPADKLRVSESGINTRRDIIMLQQAGFNAALIGESLMRRNDKSAFLCELRGDELCG